jgi:endonuclease-3
MNKVTKKSTKVELTVKALLALMPRYYPDAKCALLFDTPFELLVATILSAQCTDERVNKTTRTLFKKYPKPTDYAEASLSELEKDLSSINFFRNKAKSIQATARLLGERHGGEVPQNLEDLVALPGVGRKTANVVLGNAFGIPSGVVVDTHVLRLSRRLGLTKQKTPEKIELDLIKLVPKQHWINFSHWLILHGRQVCKARKAQCSTCFLEESCPKKMG